MKNQTVLNKLTKAYDKVAKAFEDIEKAYNENNIMKFLTASAAFFKHEDAFKCTSTAMIKIRSYNVDERMDLDATVRLYRAKINVYYTRLSKMQHTLFTKVATSSMKAEE